MSAARRRTLRRAVVGTLVGAVLAYAMIAASLYAAQRNLIYPAPVAYAQVPAGYDEVSLRTADGLSLAAAWHPPAPGKPVALFFHGNGDDWAGGAKAMAELEQAGFGVLLPEYRGYGTNPGQPDEAGFYADGRAALAWLAERGIAIDKVVLIGNSIGGGTATQLASEAQPAALILVSPFSTLPDVVAERFPWLPGRWLVKDRFDNAAKVGRVASPVLVLHGTADDQIPHQHSLRLARAAPAARLVLVPGVNHELAWLPQAQRAEAEWLAGLEL